jgi:hypothetical protein
MKTAPGGKKFKRNYEKLEDGGEEMDVVKQLPPIASALFDTRILKLAVPVFIIGVVIVVKIVPIETLTT